MSNLKTADVIIIGAGLSGIGAACHLKLKAPAKSVILLESRDAIGGTWDLFRYPGIRSDSDMYTLGYIFKPWTNPKAIADGPAIRDYVNETADEYGIREKIQFGKRVQQLSWNSEKAEWTLDVLDHASGKTAKYKARFVISCTGYYRYDAGYTPEFAGRENFLGQVIHPQLWPENLDYSGKRVVVIGSGATAVTLVPSMTRDAAHVTMLQRSPSYVVSVPQEDIISNKLRGKLPEKWVYHSARARNVGLQMLVYRLSKRAPQLVRRLLTKQVQVQVGKKVDMKHFTPSYNPWDERLCAVPNGDLFKALRSGKASVVTDHIDHFTEHGIALKSGDHLDADIIVTATGLQLQLMGGAKMKIDGKTVSLADSVSYKGIMFGNVPNLAMIFGYTNASWTLKADISSDFVCRLINRMDKDGTDICVASHEPDAIEIEPFLDMTSGYVQRAMKTLPKQGRFAPWKLRQNYFFDFAQLKVSKLDDGIMHFKKAGQPA
jgi:cation diffusion facilitator CzcD-associated flavoprotein CzcO